MSSPNRDLILGTHYGVVRYLYYEVFLKRRNQIDDLQNQVLFLGCINKYMLCRNGQYAHLYNMYTNLQREQIVEYYETKRLKISSSRDEWLNYCNFITAPRILPRTIDGPYMIDGMALRRYSYFWGAEKTKFTSNIIATPFFCLDGIDHLYQEMIKWKAACENIDVQMTVQAKHIFHDVFYLVNFRGTTQRTQDVDIRFLLWLDDTDIQSELYCPSSEDDIGSLLKRLYIASNSSLFMSQLSDLEVTTNSQNLRLLSIFVQGLSSNFVPTFNGKAPKRTRTVLLDVTNQCTKDATLNCELNFTSISRYGLQPTTKDDQIYEIEQMADLNTEAIITPNCLVVQQEIRCSRQPTLQEMNSYLAEFFQLLALGMVDKDILMRIYRLPEDNRLRPNSMSKQLNIVYMQKFNRFDISRETINYDPTFFDKTYVYAARNLVCTIKSMKYLLQRVIVSSPILPPSVLFMPLSPTNIRQPWRRITQNIIYIKSLRTVFFVKNFTLQHLNNPTQDSDTDPEDRSSIGDIKSLQIATDLQMRDELGRIFMNSGGISRCDLKTVCTFSDIDLRSIMFEEKFKWEIYYFAMGSFTGADPTDKFKEHFLRFMQTPETRQRLGDKIFTIFMHMVNLYRHNILL